MLGTLNIIYHIKCWTHCYQQILALPSSPEIMYSSWLKLVKWLARSNQSALLQCYAKKIYYIDSWLRWGKKYHIMGQMNIIFWELTLVWRCMKRVESWCRSKLYEGGSKQYDQIGQLIGLWATFQSLWQQLICPNFLHS